LYVLAFVAVAVLSGAAASALSKLDPTHRLEVWTLRVLAGFYLLVLLSTFPRKIGYAWSEVHDDIGIALFAFEFVLAIWLTVRARPPVAVVGFFVQLVGATIALLSVLKVDHLLFVGQTVESLGFACLISATVPASSTRRLASS
jgi:hypothetical protein